MQEFLSAHIAKSSKNSKVMRDEKTKLLSKTNLNGNAEPSISPMTAINNRYVATNEL